MPDMRIADFLRHDAQTYGVPGAPSIEKILEACVAAANWIDELQSRLAQAEFERDAAVADLAEGRNCADCKHYYESVFDEPCSSCVADEETKKDWQWRGVCEENTKECANDENA